MEKKTLFKKLRIYLSLILIATFLFSSNTFAKYASEGTAESTARVALFAQDISTDIPLTAEYYPGNQVEIPLRVANYVTEGGTQRVCEVTQDFTLKAEQMTGRLPLTLSWKGPDGNPLAADKSPTGRFQASDAAIYYTYTLVVEWSVDDADYKYADELEVIRITATATQVG